MNKEKTKLIWIGRKKNTIEELITDIPLKWGDTTFDLLGIHYNVELKKMIETNYNKCITQVQNIIKHWNKRQLTPIGKIAVIKTFIISKFIHVFTSLPTPGDDIIKKINFYNV